MERVTKIKTYDGELHDDQKAAMHHLDKLYGDVLLHVGKKLAACDGKYTKLVDCVDQSLPEFETMLIIKRDMVLEADTDSED